MDSIHFIDKSIILVYFLIVIAIAVVVGRKTKDGDDLFLAGRSLTWGFIGLSLFASNISSTTLIGLTGAAYNNGIADSVYEWGSAIPMAILAVVFVPIYLRSRITTIPEFLELRFDRRSRLMFSALTIVASLVVDTAGSLYAGAIVLKTFFPELAFLDGEVASLYPIVIGLAVFAAIYTAMGGLKAVVYTDALQAIILIAGSSILAYIMFSKMGFDWGAVMDSASPSSTTPERHMSVVRPLDDPQMPWSGLWLAVPFLGFWYMATNQYITQRVLGAKDINHARWGISLAALLKFLPLFIMLIPGVMAITLINDGTFPGQHEIFAANGDSVFPFIVSKFLPVGVVGLVLAGLVSAIMSSVDSTLNSASTLVVMDFINNDKREVSPKDQAKYGRITIFVLMVLAAAWAPQISNAGGLWGYIQGVYGIFVPPVVVLFIGGAFYKRANGDGAFWTLIIGILAGLFLFFSNFLINFETGSGGQLLNSDNALYGFFSTFDMHYTFRIGISVAVSLSVFILVSAMTPAPSQEVIDRFMFKKDMIREGTEGQPWYKNYLNQTAVLLVIVALFYVWFW